VLVIVPAPSVPEAATGTAWPWGTTRTERATASETVALVPFTVMVWRPTLSTRTGKRTPVTWPGPRSMSMPVAPSGVNQSAGCISTRTVCAVSR
jgi:hypothetical protein